MCIEWHLLVLVSSLECIVVVAYKSNGNAASRLCGEKNTEEQEEGKYKEAELCGRKGKRTKRSRKVEVTELGVFSFTRFHSDFNGFDQQRGGFQDLGSHLLPRIISRYMPPSSISLCQASL
jgi:hypothetical protein